MTEMYLGRTLAGDDLELDPDRLRTHGVVVGMTGSGKTGLSLVVLEELVRAKVPVIAIDPKGDLGNLGLLFPEFRADDYAPWCGDEPPQAVADRWQQGLLRSGLLAPRVKALRDGMQLTVYSPGSTAGVPVNLLGMLAAPDADTLGDVEARAELVAGTVSGLLGLTGRDSDPIQDPAHVVLSQILDQAWQAGEDLDLSTLVLRLVDPPFEKVGVFPLDAFFAPDARMKLAMAFNALLAAPSFAAWTQGANLDVAAMLAEGERTGVHVFSLAHLDEAQRQFFVSLLTSNMLAWSRRQPGSDRLRAVLFFDEVAGYLPPHPKNPPTKAPLLTMMKQARAVGLGVLLSTQNPVDLDYKALSNAGLWAIGRLNTAQDRARVLKGIDAQDLDATVAKLEKRQFLLHLVGRGAPQVFSTRHAMCYLRGPLTRVEIGALNTLWGASTEATPKASPPTAEPAPESPSLAAAPPSVPGVKAWFLDPRVAFCARLQDAFAAHASPRREDGKLAFAPALWADLSLRFDEDRVGFVVDRHLRRVFYPLADGMSDAPLAVALEPDDLGQDAPEGAIFAPLPDWMDESKEWKQLEKRFVDDVYATESEGMFVNKPLKLYGRAGESREDFDLRCEAEVQARIDAAAAKLKDRHDKKLERIRDRIDKLEGKLEQLESTARSRQLEEAVNIGATIFSFFGGRKKSLTSAVSKRRQSAQAGARVDQTEADIERLTEDAEQLAEALTEDLEKIEADERGALDETETKAVRLEKADIRVEAFGLLWVPASRRI